MARGRLLVELGRCGRSDRGGARPRSKPPPSAGERARALIAMAAGMRLNDRIAEGLAALDEAEPLATRGRARARPVAPASPARQPPLSPRPRRSTACASTSRAPACARDAGSLEAEAAAMGGLGDGYYLQGRMRSANRQFRACVAMARQHGFGRLEVANLP